MNFKQKESPQPRLGGTPGRRLQEIEDWQGNLHFEDFMPF